MNSYAQNQAFDARVCFFTVSRYSALALNLNSQPIFWGVDC